MSILRRGDEELHYSDNSHRWIAPPDVAQSMWEADMRTHLSQHLTTMGGPPHLDEVSFCRPRRVPGQVTQLPKKVPARHNGVEVPRPGLPSQVKDRAARTLPGAA